MKAAWFTSCFDRSYIELDRLRYQPSLNEAQAMGIARLLGMHRKGHWLDVCCGYGRHLLPLVARGYDITGIDLSGAMLHALRDEAQRRGLPARTFQADIREIPLRNAFHGAYLAGSSFGIFDDPRDNLQALKSIHQSLRAGGKFLIDQANPHLIFQEGTSDHNVFHFPSQNVEEELVRDIDRRRFVLRRTLRRGCWEKQWVMQYHAYDAETLNKLLEQAGFSTAGHYGNLNGFPYDENSPRLVLVADCRK